jgi:PHD/YefM family antitoxin component YafN of YafNO toxin-antitoxin module
MTTKRKTAALRVTSGAFQRAFGRYREIALQAPVSITNHGRDSLVLLSASEYERLRRLDRRVIRPWELSEQELDEIAKTEPPAEAAKYDRLRKTRRR